MSCNYIAISSANTQLSIDRKLEPWGEASYPKLLCFIATSKCFSDFCNYCITFCFLITLYFSTPSIHLLLLCSLSSQPVMKLLEVTSVWSIECLTQSYRAFGETQISVLPGHWHPTFVSVINCLNCGHYVKLSLTNLVAFYNRHTRVLQYYGMREEPLASSTWTCTQYLTHNILVL